MLTALKLSKMARKSTENSSNPMTKKTNHRNALCERVITGGQGIGDGVFFDVLFVENDDQDAAAQDGRRHKTKHGWSAWCILQEVLADPFAKGVEAPGKVEGKGKSKRC